MYPRSRREFLKQAAATTAALSLARSVHAAGRDEIRIGMIGCGGRCSGAANAALELGKDIKLAAMTDVFESRMAAKRDLFRAKYPDQFIATPETCSFGLDGYKAVIAASDAVLIACSSKYHAFYAEKAIEAGKHVFIEKPHAIDPAGCKRLGRLCELAQQKNLCVVSGHESRYSLPYQEQVRRIHDGVIGKVVAIQSMFLRGPYSTVRRDPKLNEVEWQFSNWYHFRWLSGDDVTQSLVHNLDRMRWVLHEENPAVCFGLGGRSASFGEVYGDMFDHHSVVYDFKSGPRLYGMNNTQVNCFPQWDDIIMGTKGTCYWSACRIEGETNWRYDGPRNDPHAEEQKILVGALREGRVVNHRDTMIDSTAMAIMGQLACYTGKPVTWEEFARLDFEFEPKLADVRLDMPPSIVPDATGNYPLPRPGLTTFS